MFQEVQRVKCFWSSSFTYNKVPKENIAQKNMNESIYYSISCNTKLKKAKY